MEVRIAAVAKAAAEAEAEALTEAAAKAAASQRVILRCRTEERWGSTIRMRGGDIKPHPGPVQQKEVMQGIAQQETHDVRRTMHAARRVPHDEVRMMRAV